MVTFSLLIKYAINDYFTILHICTRVLGVEGQDGWLRKSCYYRIILNNLGEELLGEIKMNWHGKPRTYCRLMNNSTSPSLHLTKNSSNLKARPLKPPNLDGSRQVPQAIYTTPLLRMARDTRT